MLLSWTALAFLLLAAAVAWFWQDSLATRELANTAAIEACGRLSLQFLDGTVAFARIGWTRGPGGGLALRRTYVFDYTANSIERLQGFVVLTGHRVETVGYAAGQPVARSSLLDGPQSIEPTPPVDPSSAGPSNVLDLDRWRANHRQSALPPRESREDRGDRRH
ncbi:MAG TPA: DUF3301 domain-containing protein [Povalibacter sp.]|nr:DUF3301 domain-containing protein [Povalibacter sp.]